MKQKWIIFLSLLGLFTITFGERKRSASNTEVDENDQIQAENIFIPIYLQHDHPAVYEVPESVANYPRSDYGNDQLVLSSPGPSSNILPRPNDHSTVGIRYEDGHSNYHIKINPIPGIPGEDYPVFSQVPFTRFRCKDVPYPGFYADVESGCQVWHYCQLDSRQDSFLCTNGTIFNQETRVCDWWYNVNCPDSIYLYGVNADLFRIPDKSNYIGENFGHRKHNEISQPKRTNLRHFTPNRALVSTADEQLHKHVLSGPLNAGYAVNSLPASLSDVFPHPIPKINVPLHQSNNHRSNYQQGYSPTYHSPKLLFVQCN
ncbi:uncharacterized protein LOC106462801 [Limulus polyphemus]|uniref:Uncharacterized protein LOC106462801 n=1 Tax=Limulus polyphemus TaxID=6850 RepID=A0ABM1BAN9_LIMPO|nr:uncharacterized protein LOC106462801 [Limulus polyphemus]